MGTAYRTNTKRIAKMCEILAQEGLLADAFPHDMDLFRHNILLITPIKYLRLKGMEREQVPRRKFVIRDESSRRLYLACDNTEGRMAEERGFPSLGAAVDFLAGIYDKTNACQYHAFRHRESALGKRRPCRPRDEREEYRRQVRELRAKNFPYAQIDLLYARQKTFEKASMEAVGKNLQEWSPQGILSRAYGERIVQIVMQVQRKKLRGVTS